MPGKIADVSLAAKGRLSYEWALRRMGIKIGEMTKEQRLYQTSS